MVRQAHALVTGLFVIALCGVLVLLAVWLTGDRSDGRAFVLVANREVTGLDRHGRVFYRGLRAGEVERMEVDPTDRRQILVHVQLKKHVPVTRGTFGRLRVEGITGSRSIVLDDT